MREITYKQFVATGAIRNSSNSTRYNERTKETRYFTMNTGVLYYKTDLPG